METGKRTGRKCFCFFVIDLPAHNFIIAVNSWVVNLTNDRRPAPTSIIADDSTIVVKETRLDAPDCKADFHSFFLQI